MATSDNGSFGSNFANFLTGMTGEIYKRQAEEQAIKQKDEDSALQLNLNLFSNMLSHPGQFNEQQIRQHADMVAKNPRMGRIVGKDYQNQITPLLQATQEAYRDAIANDLGKISGQDPRTMSVDQIAQWKVKKGELERETAAQAEKNRQWQADYDLTKLGQDQAQTYQQADLAGNIQGRTEAAARDMELLKRQIAEEGRASDFRIQSLLGDQQARKDQSAFQLDSLRLQKDQYSPENRQRAEENDAFRTALSAAMSSRQMTSDQAIEAGKQAAMAVRSRYATLAPTTPPPSGSDPRGLVQTVEPIPQMTQEDWKKAQYKYGNNIGTIGDSSVQPFLNNESSKYKKIGTQPGDNLPKVYDPTGLVGWFNRLLGK
jgi:hypothetical protein